jgi:hopanoid biosynthesis associated protein HpnK
MKTVILNGDDFGLAPAIDAGILEAHERGCLTSASLSVVGPTAEEAAAAVRGFPDLGIGLHLTLVDEYPVSDPASIPSLVDRGGRFFASGVALARRWCTGRIRGEEARREIRAQFARARDLGVSLTHVDSHDHVHVLPGLFEILVEEMTRAGLWRLRIPLEAGAVGPISWPRRAAGLGLGLLARRAARIARRRGLAFPDRFLGFRGAGQIDTAALVARLESVGPGTTEIALHPAAGSGPPRADFAGWGYRWDLELQALLAPEVRDVLDRLEIRSESFTALPSAAQTEASSR